MKNQLSKFQIETLVLEASVSCGKKGTDFDSETVAASLIEVLEKNQHILAKDDFSVIAGAAGFILAQGIILKGGVQ